MVPFASRYDAVIVGGGHNGLVAAAYLARAGQSVLLLERDAELGGATTSKPIFAGMDARLSRYAYLVSLFPDAIVRDLGLRFARRRRAIASCTPYVRDGRHSALLLSSVDEAASHSSLLQLTDGHDLRGYMRLLELEGELAGRVWPSLLQPLRSRADWLASLDTAPGREAWDWFVERPLGECIERHVHNDLLRGLVMTDGKIGVFTHAHDPSLLQNRCFILHVIGGGTGEWQVPVGGMGALAGALTAAASAAGVRLETATEAISIDPGKPRHAVTFLQGETEHTVGATRVLVNAGPQVFAQLMNEPYQVHVNDEGSVCKVNMLVKRLPRLRAGTGPPAAFAGTFHVDESYSQMHTSYGQAAEARVPERLPFEMYCHTLTDPSILGPELREVGYHTLTLFGLDMPYRLFEGDNEAVKVIVMDRYLSGLNAVLDDSIIECLAIDGNGRPCIEIKSPLDLERELTLNRGNIFHGELSWFFADSEETTGAWGVETAHPRIYNCGSSAIRGGAVSGIPGRNAARCILLELGIEK